MLSKLNFGIHAKVIKKKTNEKEKVPPFNSVINIYIYSPTTNVHTKKRLEREMSKPSLSLRLTFLLSLSFTASSFPFFHKPSSPSTPKATPSDLLSILGPKPQSSKINPLIAQDLNSCLKFLVPFNPTSPKLRSRKCLTRRKELGLTKIGATNQREEDELIWWPPEPVLELARLAIDSGGDPAAIQRALDPTIITVSFFFLLGKW